ncbi:MAG: FtsX-like permease family protein [Marinoscillum sp.]|uniref:ABC transporter permease n=1 Tax=Marinoscillum sp. TaxID=2024838 RepID=UPI0032F7FF5B
MEVTPPKRALKFLRWFCREEFLEEIEGDLMELFEKRAGVSLQSARRKFLWDVVCAFRPINIKSFTINNWTMNAIQNYTKVYFRRFRKETTHYLVNTLGLALGFAVLFFILMYVYDEEHLDRYHTKADRIYRVLEKRTGEDGEVQHFSATSNMLADGLKDEFPEIEETAKMLSLGSGGLQYGETLFNDRNYVFATKSLFKILDFNILAGDPFQDVNGSVGVVLNETTAQKLFRDEDPIGKIVTMPGRMSSVEVVAVYEDLPATSTYQFNTVYVSDFTQFPSYYGNWLTSWDSRGMTTWALFKEESRPESVQAKKKAFMEKYYNDEIRPHHDFYFQPIAEMHLSSAHLDAFGTDPVQAVPYSQRQFVSIIFLIGIFVITIAALNYINLSSVQALKRTLEAGIRKVNGATIGQLRFQLFVETFLTLLIAYVLSVALLIIFHSKFLEFSGKDIPLGRFFSPELLAYHAAAFGVIWVLSSLIPAIYYSKLNHSLMLTRNVFVGKGDLLRKSFVVVQYGISLCLIIGSIVLYRQLHFVQTKDLGFKNDKLLTLDINSGAARQQFKSIITGLKANANVINATTSSRVPGEWKSIPSVELTLVQNENPVVATHYAADENWLDTYQMKLKAGSNFSGIAGSDTLKVILNEKAVELLGLEDPVGKSVWLSEDTLSKMQIIGVVKDFHFQSLHEPLGPVVITSWNNPVLGIDYFTIRYRENVSDVLTHIETVQKRYDPETPAEINFLDERWERYYQADQSRSYLILIATIISIIISAFGLFGLVNFTVERKTKEVGIRKVLGASIPNILQIILRDYVVLLLISLIVAAPVAWWVLSSWLQDFAYRIDLSVGVFTIAFAAVLVVSFATVIARVYRLAKSNPVNSLRYE